MSLCDEYGRMLLSPFHDKPDSDCSIAFPPAFTSSFF
jgi:hypothetical protein